MDEVKNKLEVALIATAIIGFVIVMMLGLVLEVKHTIRMKVYAVSHDCTWSYQGDVPGNDDGYICRNN